MPRSSLRRYYKERFTEKEKQTLAPADEGELADFRDAALDAPVEGRKKIEFAPIDQGEEEDDDYDE